MSQIPNGPMTVVGLEVESFKRLRAAHLTPSATGLIPVRGKNEAGKSSLIGSMLEALGVERSKLPIHNGDRSGSVVLDLGEIVVERKWTRDSLGKAKAALTVRGRDGGKLRSPQAILANLVGRFADPVAFLGLKPAEQVKVVLEVLNLTEGLEALEHEEAIAFETRRDTKRDLAQAKAAVDALAEEVAALPECDELDVTELSEELRQANAANAARAQKVSACDRQKDVGAQMAKAVERDQQRVQDLEDELASARESLAESQAQLETARETWRALSADVAKYPEIDVAPIHSRLEAARQAEDARSKRTLYDKEVAKRDDLESAVKSCEEAVDEIRVRINDLLSSTPFPVPGMTYNPETKGLEIDGIPFEQASQAQRLKAAAKVAMSGSPAIRVMFARDGSLLDEDSQRVLAEAAEEAGFQFWLEIVDSNPEGVGIWIEDGEAVQSDAAPAPDVTAS